MMARQIVGIDISKSTFDAAWSSQDAGGWQYFHGQQQPDTYAALLEAAPPGAVFVMEATGVYALRLALRRSAATVAIPVTATHPKPGIATLCSR